MRWHMMPKNIRSFFVVFLVVFFAFGTDLAKSKKGAFFSDESSYFSILQSLAYDGDLEYGREDIVRIRGDFWAGPMGLFLKKGPQGRLVYAKSFMYPLAAAPFFRLFGTHGILLFNGLMIWAVLLMGYLLLRQHHGPGKSLFFTIAYLFSSIAFIYIWWITADLFNFFVTFAALFFFFYEFKNPRWACLAGVFFAAAIFSKPNNVLHIGFLFLLLLYRRQWKRFVVLALISVLIVAGLFAFNYAQTGSLNFQGGERRSFYGNFPFERPDFTFAGGFLMSSDTYWNYFYLSPAIVLQNSFYYVFGRFTGMFIYFFPALFILLLFFFGKKDPEDWFLLAGIIAAVYCYILLMPGNYFGGGGSLGNRYFLNIFPLFFFLGYRRRTFRLPWLPVCIGLAFLAPVFMDPMYHSANPRFPGISFPARLFPVEKTQFVSLPSNTNPRAFNLKVGDRYALFFLNDNFNPMEGEAFWTNGDKELELFLLAPYPVKTFTVQLKNIPRANQVRIQIEHKQKTFYIEPGGVRLVTFSNIPGLRVDRRYIYHIKAKSALAYCPYFESGPQTLDRRILGVQAHIQVSY
jgi:hypothetical protein